MAKKKYEEANIQAIADAIRTKTGTEQTYKTSEMASGVNEVYEKGAFDYFEPMVGNFTGTTITVPYGIKRVDWFSFYYRSNVAHIVLPDTVTYLGNSAIRNCEKLLDFRFPPNINVPFGNSYTFGDNKRMKTVTFPNGFQQSMSSSTFYNCTALTDIIVESGEFEGSLYFLQSPISVESMKTIITHLKNYAGTEKEGAYTVRFTDACWTALEADSKAPNGDTWKNYVIYTLGWTI